MYVNLYSYPRLLNVPERESHHLPRRLGWFAALFYSLRIQRDPEILCSCAHEIRFQARPGRD
jgi:hypothetical protein